MKKTEIWINLAKFIAIFAVLVDHSYGLLYHRSSIQFLSVYSVYLFILLMGITNYWSFERNFGNLKKKVLFGILHIGGAYILATAIYQVTAYHSFDLLRFLTALIYFNASGPFYFVLLYIQLLIAAPFLFYAMKLSYNRYMNSKVKIWTAHIIIGGGVLLTSSLTNRFTNILGIYGGGGVLFGGTYLFQLFLGMLIAENYRFLRGGFLGFIVFLGLTICWWRFICLDHFSLDSRLPFGQPGSQASISAVLFALMVAGLVYNLDCIMSSFHFTKKISSIWSWLGKHTLYIFLYHRYFLDFWLARLEFLERNIWIKRISYITVMVFGSIAIEYVVRWGKKKFLKGKTIVSEMTEKTKIVV